MVTVSAAAEPASAAAVEPARGADRRPLGLTVVAAVLLALLLARRVFGTPDLPGRLRDATTVFLAVVVQATPFLVLGVALSALLAAYATPATLGRLLPRRAALAVPVAALAGAALPGCECASVPLAGRMVARGAHPSAALAFLLSAPAINPVVLVATAVAFPGRPGMVLARGVSSLVASMVVGWIWSVRGKAAWTPVRPEPARSGSRSAVALDTALHDLLHAGGFLVVGALAAAVLQALVPRSLLSTLGGTPVLAVAVCAVLAVALAICSEADAFVAAGLTQFPLSARLVFLVVGPAVDVKLIALQTGTFGWRFAARFAPLAFCVAVASAVAVGAVVL